MLKLVLGAVALLILLGVVAATLLPWWGVLALVVGIIVSGAFVLPRLVRKLFEAPFRAKGAALRGAKVEVHAISRAEPPTAEEDDEPLAPDLTSRRWLFVDLTVTPTNAEGPFQHWEPGELILCAPGSDIGDDDDSCEVWDYKLVADGAIVEDEEYKHQGPKRIRLQVGVRSDVRDLSLRYYFEDLAPLQLPFP